MTLVDVCSTCETMFNEGDEHCSHCGADRSDAIKREMREMCYTYTGEEPESDEIARIVKPSFTPKWGKPQWYEMGDGESPAEEEPEEVPDDEGTDD